MVLVGAATGTLPAMIAGEIGGRTVDYGSRKLTGKSWGENVLPEAPMIGELTNPGYIVGGLAGQYRKQIKDAVINSTRGVNNIVNGFKNVDKNLARGQFVSNKSSEFFNELQNSKGFQKRFEDYVGNSEFDDYASFSLDNGPKIVGIGVNTYAYRPLKNNPIFNSETRLPKKEFYNEVKGNSGVYIPSTNEIGVASTTKNGIPIKDVDIYNTTSHELLHRYSQYNKGNNVLQYSDKNMYYIPANNWEHKDEFMKFVNTNEPWAMSPEEHVAELVGNRAVKKIDNNLNYTTEQAEQFINNKRFRRLYSDKVHNENGNERASAINFIKKFGVIATPIGIGYGLTKQQ